MRFLLATSMLLFPLISRAGPTAAEACLAATRYDIGAPYAFSGYERPLDACRPLEGELGITLDNFVAVEERTLVFSGMLAASGSEPAALGLVWIRFDPDGKIAERRVLGRIPAPGAPKRRLFQALRSFLGSTKIFVQVQGDRAREFWELDLTGQAKPRAVPVSFHARSFYPTAKGNLVLSREAKEGSAEKRAAVLVPGQGGKERELAVLTGAMDEVQDAPLLSLATAAGGQLFDLVEERLIPLKDLPPEPQLLSAFSGRELLFLAVDTAVPADKVNEACPPMALYKLPHPWTSAPVKVASQLEAASIEMRTRQDQVIFARNLRWPWPMQLRFPGEPDDDDDGDDPAPCATGMLTTSFNPQADFFSYSAATGTTTALGCKQAPSPEVSGRPEQILLWSERFTEPCLAPKPLEKRVAAIKVPRLKSCAPLAKRIEHCLAAFQAGDVRGVADCRGDDRDAPDLGSSTSLYFNWLVEVRMWALREFMANPKLKPTIQSDAREAMVRFTSKSGKSALTLRYQKGDCEWTLGDAAITAP
jgi:hypothetical protein